jgi:hypothetical protein
MTENGSLNVINPATEESIEEIGTSSREDLDRTAERPETPSGSGGQSRGWSALSSSTRYPTTCEATPTSSRRS